MFEALILLVGFIFFWHVVHVMLTPPKPAPKPPCQCGDKKGKKIKDLTFFLEVCDMMAEDKKDS